MTTISQSEAARRAGISRPAIKKNIDAGKIKSDGGRVILASFEEWMTTRSGVQPDLQPDATKVAEGEAADLLAKGLMPTAIAFQVEQNYKALQRKLEYDQKSGRVVDADLIAKAVGAKFATVRTKLLAIPAEQAPTLARCKTPRELRDRLEKLIFRALEELTLDADPTNGLSRGV